MSSFSCFQCGHQIQVMGVVGRRDECPKCHADQHSCRNCQFYDSKAYNECKEPVAEVVKEKNRANFCDQFAPGSQLGGSGSGRDQLMSAAEALFKKK